MYCMTRPKQIFHKSLIAIAERNIFISNADCFINTYFNPKTKKWIEIDGFMILTNISL